MVSFRKSPWESFILPGARYLHLSRAAAIGRVTMASRLPPEFGPMQSGLPAPATASPKRLRDPLPLSCSLASSARLR